MGNINIKIDTTSNYEVLTHLIEDGELWVSFYQIPLLAVKSYNAVSNENDVDYVVINRIRITTKEMMCYFYDPGEYQATGEYKEIGYFNSMNFIGIDTKELSDLLNNIYMEYMIDYQL